MNANCMICTDLFTPSSEVYATTCGHMFHYACLMQWIERSKTCPQCRCKVTEKTMHRVFFNTQNTENITEDVGALQNQVDNLNFQMRLKEKDAKIYNEKYHKMKNQNIGLREEVKGLEDKMRVAESAIHAQKQQTLFYKKKYQEMELMAEELQRMKDQLKNAQNVELVLKGSRQQVANMLMQNQDKDSLCLLVNTLKKELVDVSNRARLLKKAVTDKNNENSILKKENEKLETENRRLVTESQINWQVQMKVLKNKIIELEKKLQEKNANSSILQSPNNTVQRIINESPAPLRVGNRLSMSDMAQSPTLEECVRQIENSDSPYLPIKSAGGLSTNLLKTKYITVNKLDRSQKPQPNAVNPMNLLLKCHEQSKLNNKDKKMDPDVCYDGFGGHSKIDIFPSPRRLPPSSMKRLKPNSFMSANKFKKLTPNIKIDKS